MSSADPFRTFRDLLRWSPFSDIDMMLPRTGEGLFTPDIDVKETPDALVMKVDLPGMREEDIDIAIIGNRLSISGRREEEQRREDEHIYAYERQYGAFTRTFVLPDTYDADNVSAEMKDGVLTVKVSKRPGAQARHIPVKAQSQAQGSPGGQSSGRTALETQSTGAARATSADQSAGGGRSTSESSSQGERAAAGSAKPG